jgi:hypothetical protein
MPYVTWSEAEEYALGPTRFRDEVMAGHVDTAQSHPFFDRQLRAVEIEVDQALDAGGYDHPLDTPITDEALRNAILGLLIGKLTATNSSKQQWMRDVETAGKALLSQIRAGEWAVVGAVEDDAASEESTGIGMIDSMYGDDAPQFDIGNPYATTHDVFRPLAAPRYRRFR